MAIVFGHEIHFSFLNFAKIHIFIPKSTKEEEGGGGPPVYEIFLKNIYLGASQKPFPRRHFLVKNVAAFVMLDYFHAQSSWLSC